MALFNGWEGNTQIITPATQIPLCSSGPTLISTPPVLYMFYSGEGNNLWWATSQAPDFPSFQGNNQAKSTTDGSAPKTDFRPAAVMLPNGMIHTVYEGKSGGDLWWAWLDGAQTWRGNVRLPFAANLPRPTLTYFGGQLHLVWHNQVPAVTSGGRVTSSGHEFLAHSALTPPKDPFQSPSVNDWSEPQNIADGMDFPSIVPFNNQLYVVGRNYPYGANPTPEGFAYVKWNGQPLAANSLLKITPVAIVGENPETSSGPTATVIGSNLVFVYQGEGGKNIWYAWMTIDPSTHADLFHGNVQIKTANSTPETSSLVGITSFAGKVCLAYKGQGSGKIYTVSASLPS